MKTILLLLLCCPSFAQTLRWTQPLPPPGFDHITTFFTGTEGDTLGNVAVRMDYNKQDGPSQPFSGSQLLWFSSKGVLIHAEDFPADGNTDPRVISVSATVLVVCFVEVNGLTVLRKYTKRRTGVTFADTILPEGEDVAAVFAVPRVTDRHGFFVVVRDQGGNATGLKRYTIR